MSHDHDDDDRRDPTPDEGMDESPVRRPGPHGADAEITRAHRRAEKSSRRAFEEVSPQPIAAAEAVTALDDENEYPPQSHKGKLPLVKSRACFIATAAYGTDDAPEVEQLRRFRDERLLKSAVGTMLVRLYYRVSPPIARLVARKPRLRVAVRRALDYFRNRAAL